MFEFLMICAIQLGGVTGADLRARAFFDANNVKVGDPLVLTVDFVGQAEFRDLHPPVLSRYVSRKDWKVDDASAKTDTFHDARRLTYRVRPMREGVLWFPALAFAYAAADGSERLVRANAIPVHARAGAQVVVAEMAEDPNALPPPPDLVSEADFAAPGLALSADERFAWQRALAHPTAKGFAAFDFPAAKLNEATCHIREGNWALALSVYRRLEWRIGQTPEVEKGFVAALAHKTDNPSAELPVARQVLRPLLRFGWKGRAGLLSGALAALLALYGLFGRVIRAFACVALVLAPVSTVSAETVETVTTNADGSVTHRKVVTGGSGNVSFSFSSSRSSGAKGVPATGAHGLFGADPFKLMEDFDPFRMSRSRTRRPSADVAVRLEADKPAVAVGEDFNLILYIDQPRFISFADGVRLSIAEQGRMRQVGDGQALKSVKSENPTNLIQRLVFRMRANEPFTNLHYSVEGDYVYASDHPFFRTATPYLSGEKVASLVVGPLPEEGRPADFSGIVSDGLAIFETCDILSVHTNDVVTISYRLKPNGYVPAAFQPKDVAFEWLRQSDRAGNLSEIEYRRYLVADGLPKTPLLSVSYYDPRKKAYRRAAAGGTALTYRPAAD